MCKRIAVVAAVLDHPELCAASFNKEVASFHGIIKGRMGIPFDDEEMAVISLTVVGELDEINALTGRLGRIPGINVKTAISVKEIAPHDVK